MTGETGTGSNKYIVEVSWGCPSDKYPLNGLFQFDQALALQKVGRDVVFLALDMRSFRRWRKWGINRFEKDGIPVFEYNFPYGPFSPETKYRIQKKGFERCLKMMEESFGRPLCVHFHGVMEAVSGMDHCLENKIPYVITEHITPVSEGDTVCKWMKEAYAKADKVIAVSNKLASDIKKAYGAKTDAVIPNIVDLEVFSPREEKSGDAPAPSGEGGTAADGGAGTGKTFRFISAAGLNAGKGMDVLLNAFAKLRELTGPEIKPYLTIMGDGDRMNDLVRLRDFLGLSDIVYFTGAYIRPEFADFLRESDCFVLASRSETFGIVYVEAMAAGVPVIATVCGGPEDFVDDECGILVPVDDTDGLARAMYEMTRSSGRYNSRLISEKCRKMFSSDSIGRRISEVLPGT